MQFLVILLVLVVALIYLAYIACSVPIGAVLAFTAYCVGMPVTYFISLGRVLLPRAPVQPSPAARPKMPADADPAVLQYFYGAALTDARDALRITHRDGRRLWRWGARNITSALTWEGVLWTGPFGVGAAIGMAAGTAIGAVATTGCACVQLFAVGTSSALVRAAGTMLRLADSAVLRVRNVRMICPECHEHVRYPGYECPRGNCPRRHRDIRPGRFGILRRHCQCGEPMETLLLFGSARMKAYCPHCGTSLEHGPGHAPEISLPFVGAIGAGKTRLLFSMVAQLQQWSREPEPEPGHGPRLTLSFGDSVTAGKLGKLDKLDNASRLLSARAAIDHTLVGLPRAYTIRLGSGRARWILHMFDAAGELFYSAERTQELGYLSKARTFILVIDPLAVEAFWDRLPPEQQAELKAVRSASLSPELAYQQTHQEIEAMGVPLRSTRLAVVFSRADLMDVPAEDVATWACDELGLGNLVRSARLHFKEACFFHTAAVMTDGSLHESIPVLTRWVLMRNGIDLPGEYS
jgi:hypothetical protein